MAQKITPNIWCNGNAREAAEFYVAVFGDGVITGGSKYPNSVEEGLLEFQKPLAGKDLTVDFRVKDLNLTAINADATFKPNPSISLMVDFNPGADENAVQTQKDVYEKLTDGGKVLMPLAKYPFSESYAWVQDKYGVSWQLMLTPAGDADSDDRQAVMPALTFAGPAQNKAAEAREFYMEVFGGSSSGLLAPYGEQTGPAMAEALTYGDFKIGKEWFLVMDSNLDEDYTFSEGVSLQVFCKDQAEIDALWGRLSAVPEAEQCGWCKDKYGVSWQIIPENLDELMQKPGAYQKMMEQHKIVIAEY